MADLERSKNDAETEIWWCFEWYYSMPCQDGCGLYRADMAFEVSCSRAKPSKVWSVPCSRRMGSFSWCSSFCFSIHFSIIHWYVLLFGAWWIMIRLCLHCTISIRTAMYLWERPVASSLCNALAHELWTLDLISWPIYCWSDCPADHGREEIERTRVVEGILKTCLDCWRWCLVIIYFVIASPLTSFQWPWSTCSLQCMQRKATGASKVYHRESEHVGDVFY